MDKILSLDCSMDALFDRTSLRRVFTSPEVFLLKIFTDLERCQQ